MDASTVISLIGLAVTVVILIVAFMVYSKTKKNAGDERIHSELEALRGELLEIRTSAKVSEETNRRTEEALSRELSSNRKEMSDRLEKVETKISQLNESNSDRQRSMTLAITDSLGKISEQNRVQNERMTAALNESMEKLTELNEKKLEQMRLTVDEKLSSTLTSRLDSSFKTVSEQLEKLYVSLGEMKTLSSGVSENITGLSRILTNVKARGTWAEYQLENILDQTIPGMYVRNFKPGGGSDVVEFAVKIPSSDDPGKVSYMPVDSKFPLEDYARLCAARESGDAALAEECSAALEKRVIAEAKTVKKYVNVPETTPFAILYLATEGLYAEIAASKNGVLERVQSEFDVLIAGPTTITALLSTIAMGYRTITLNEKANEIRVVLAAVKQQYDKFDATLQKVKKKIGEAETQIDEAANRNNIIQKKLRSIDAAEAPDSDLILGITAGTASQTEAEDD